MRIIYLFLAVYVLIDCLSQVVCQITTGKTLLYPPLAIDTKTTRRLNVPRIEELSFSLETHNNDVIKKTIPELFNQQTYGSWISLPTYAVNYRTLSSSDKELFVSVPELYLFTKNELPKHNQLDIINEFTESIGNPWFAALSTSYFNRETPYILSSINEAKYYLKTTKMPIIATIKLNESLIDHISNTVTRNNVVYTSSAFETTDFSKNYGAETVLITGWGVEEQKLFWTCKILMNGGISSFMIELGNNVASIEENMIALGEVKPSITIDSPLAIVLENCAEKSLDTSNCNVLYFTTTKSESDVINSIQIVSLNDSSRIHKISQSFVRFNKNTINELVYGNSSMQVFEKNTFMIKNLSSLNVESGYYYLSMDLKHRSNVVTYKYDTPLYISQKSNYGIFVEKVSANKNNSKPEICTGFKCYSANINEVVDVQYSLQELTGVFLNRTPLTVITEYNTGSVGNFDVMNKVLVSDVTRNIAFTPFPESFLNSIKISNMKEEEKAEIYVDLYIYLDNLPSISQKIRIYCTNLSESSSSIVDLTCDDIYIYDKDLVDNIHDKIAVSIISRPIPVKTGKCVWIRWMYPLDTKDENTKIKKNLFNVSLTNDENAIDIETSTTCMLSEGNNLLYECSYTWCIPDNTIPGLYTIKISLEDNKRDSRKVVLNVTTSTFKVVLYRVLYKLISPNQDNSFFDGKTVINYEILNIINNEAQEVFAADHDIENDQFFDSSKNQYPLIERTIDSELLLSDYVPLEQELLDKHCHFFFDLPSPSYGDCSWIAGKEYLIKWSTITDLVKTEDSDQDSLSTSINDLCSNLDVPISLSLYNTKTKKEHIIVKDITSKQKSVLYYVDTSIIDGLSKDEMESFYVKLVHSIPIGENSGKKRKTYSTQLSIYNSSYCEDDLYGTKDNDSSKSVISDTEMKLKATQSELRSDSMNEIGNKYISSYEAQMSITDIIQPIQKITTWEIGSEFTIVFSANNLTIINNNSDIENNATVEFKSDCAKYRNSYFSFEISSNELSATVGTMKLQDIFSHIVKQEVTWTNTENGIKTVNASIRVTFPSLMGSYNNVILKKGKYYLTINYHTGSNNPNVVGKVLYSLKTQDVFNIEENQGWKNSTTLRFISPVKNTVWNLGEYEGCNIMWILYDKEEFENITECDINLVLMNEKNKKITLVKGHNIHENSVKLTLPSLSTIFAINKPISAKIVINDGTKEYSSEEFILSNLDSARNSNSEILAESQTDERSMENCTKVYKKYYAIDKALYVWSHTKDKRIDGKPAWHYLTQNKNNEIDVLGRFLMKHNINEIMFFNGSVEWEWSVYFSLGHLPLEESLAESIRLLKSKYGVTKVSLLYYLNDEPDNMDNYSRVRDVGVAVNNFMNRYLIQIESVHFDQEPNNIKNYGSLLHMLQILKHELDSFVPTNSKSGLVSAKTTVAIKPIYARVLSSLYATLNTSLINENEWFKNVVKNGNKSVLLDYILSLIGSGSSIMAYSSSLTNIYQIADNALQSAKRMGEKINVTIETGTTGAASSETLNAIVANTDHWYSIFEQINNKVCAGNSNCERIVIHDYQQYYSALNGKDPVNEK